MAAPSTVSAVGYFVATRAGVARRGGDAAMKSATQGTLALGGQEWTITGDPATKTAPGTASGSPSS